MSNKLSEFLNAHKKQKFATDAGTDLHKKMQFIIIDPDKEQGDTDLIAKIKSVPELFKLFSSKSRTEVPIAGKVNGKTVSRRIDRMIKTDDNQIIFLDYKTDTNKENFHDLYVKQLREYSVLLSQIYPECSVNGYILWLCDWTLEKIS